jgi:hypothetical protein
VYSDQFHVVWYRIRIHNTAYTVPRTNVTDPHHFDADPDPACHFDADPDPTFHFDADTDPSFQKKAKNLSKVPNMLIFRTFWLVI